MISVIADDLTGAAEIGGVGWRYGLTVEVHTSLSLPLRTDLVVIDTNSRLLPAARAAERVRRAAERLKGRDGWLFKKTDSMLRGPIRAELAATMETLGYSKAILVPANPDTGRSVASGHLFFRDAPINETDFADDPHHPQGASDVRAILGEDVDWPLHVRSCRDSLPRQGIIVGNARAWTDLRSWAKRVRGRTLGAGSAAFFSAMLRSHSHRRRRRVSLCVPPALPALVCSGSASLSSRNAVRAAEASGVPVLRMPGELVQEETRGRKALSAWVRSIAGALRVSRVVIACIDRPFEKDPKAPSRFRKYIAEMVQECLAVRPPGHLLIEGGATAAAVVEHLGWRRLEVTHEWSPGVVSMRVLGAAAPVLSLKPGSYPWTSPFPT